MSLDPSLPGYTVIAELQQNNEQRIAAVNRALAPTGNQMGVDRNSAVLEALLDHTLGRTSHARAVFERNWQEQIRDNLDQAESQIRQSEITRGVNGVQGN